MNMRRFLIGALIVGALQSAAIGAMIYKHAVQLSSGKEVILESAFVDPRDLFRGHYVRLNLVVGDLSADSVEIDKAFSYNNVVYAELQKGEDNFWVAKKLWHEIPVGSVSVFIKGTIASGRTGTKRPIRIRFPFDRYFTPKKRAKELEKFRRDQKLGVVLAVSDDGTGLIKGITLEGKVIYNESLY